MFRGLILFSLLVSCVLSAEPARLKKPLCELCENVIKQVDEALKHGDDVEKAVDDFCKNDAPTFLVDFCEKIVSKNLKFIIEKLKSHASAEEICTDIYMCYV